METASNKGTVSIHVPFISQVLVTSLLTRGYFPDKAIPPVNSLGLELAVPEMIAFSRKLMEKMLSKGKVNARSRCVTHSLSKRKHLRGLSRFPILSINAC